MHHFFVTPAQVGVEKIYIEGTDVNHMRNVLRLKCGEEVSVSDGRSQKYLCRLEEYTEQAAVLTVLSREENNTELPSRLYLFQGLPKGDKIELIVQKAVELGVYEIIPVENKRCVVKLDARKSSKKRERWQAIAESGAKQSGRGMIPDVREVMSYQEALHYAGSLDVVLIPYELAENMAVTRQIVEAIEGGQSVGIFIGPEGGFTQEEIALADSCGARPITLGRRILRTETAGLAVLSILMYHLES